MTLLKSLFLSFFLLNIYSANAQLIKLMTYNIRLDLASDNENNWDHRKEIFASQIKFYEPDIMGVQEALPSQINYLDSALTFFKHIGIGREGINKGEASAIFYNPVKFDIIKTNTFWLSETPGVVSKGWDASYIRVCTYALIKDKRSKKKFWVFNTHLDNNGVVARKKGVEQILAKIKEVNTAGLPVIFMGDFNATPESEVIISLKNYMNDSKDVSVAKPFGPSGTFNGFEFSKPVTERIDYIFISRHGDFIVNKYAVLTDSDKLRYPSDHLPVYVEIKSISQEKIPAAKKRSFSSVPYWREEFNYSGVPDTTKWSYETGRAANNEIEYYTYAKNAMVSNGALSIEARKEKIDGMNYTSARMVTNGKAHFLYGRFEIRAKLSAGRGLWPAIWMMPAKDTYGGWPASGEIDIMEQVGFAPDSIHISTHTREENWMKENGSTSVAFVKTATSAFHIYRIDWTPEGIDGFIDGKKIFQHPNIYKGPGYWPFDQPFYLILNVAVGGDWGGKHGVDDSIFPKQMEVDYIRIYKMKNIK